MTRIQDFYNGLCVEMDNDYYAIAAGIENGDIEIPEYACVNAREDEVILFDAEEGGVNHWSAIRITWGCKIIDENGSEWGSGNTEEEARENAKENYLSKYPEEENNLDIVDSFDCVEK